MVAEADVLRLSMLTSGTSIIWLGHGESSSVQLPAPGPFRGWVVVEWNLEGEWWLGQAHCWVLRDRVSIPLSGHHPRELPGLLVPRWGVGGIWSAWTGWWDRPLFENYTVDASIFVVMTSY